MDSNFKNERRKTMKRISFSSAGLYLSPSVQLNTITNKKPIKQINMKRKINHSVCKWCFSQIPLEKFAMNVKAIGITGIDLIGPKDWDILKKMA